VTTLTDRYVAATLRHVPEKQRQDIERELRASIDDDIDARVGLGETADDAEYAALKELGDPEQLSMSYSGRSHSLIGPRLYPAYRTAVRDTCLSVLPIVYIVLVVVLRAHGDNLWKSIFQPLGVTLTVATYLVAALTLAFALAERKTATQQSTSDGDGPWTPDLLRSVEQSQISPSTWGDVIASAVISAIFVAALFVQRVISPVTDRAGHAVPIIAPRLWDFWVPYFIAVIVLGVLLAVLNRWLNRWNPVTATIGSVLTLAAAVPLAVLFWQAKVLNHALANGTGALAAKGSWIALLATLVLAFFVAAHSLHTWRSHRGHPVTETMRPGGDDCADR
jgi:hypothetical protein